jgi:hypothetical protein
MSQPEVGLLVELVKKDRADWTGSSEELHTHVKRVDPLEDEIVIEFLDNKRSITYPRDEWEICKVAQNHPVPEEL